MDKVKVNKNCVNAKIKAYMLTHEKMKEIGFNNYNKDSWCFRRMIKFPKENRYRNFDISFSVTLKESDLEDLRIDVLDDDFCQPYDYQAGLERIPNFEPYLIVKEQVEEWMKFLQDNGVLSGHEYGEYI